MSNGASPDDTMRERAEGSGLRLWLLLRLNRGILSGAILSGIFPALMGLSFADLSPLQTLVEEADALQNLFSSMIGPIITGVTLVVTIGQLVLSQEMGAVGDQRERMQEAMDFRRDIESAVDMGTSPRNRRRFCANSSEARRRGRKTCSRTSSGSPPSPNAPSPWGRSSCGKANAKATSKWTDRIGHTVR